MKRPLGPWDVLVAGASVVVFSAILVSVIASQLLPGQRASLISVKLVGLAALQYAQDWDNRIPRHDNNGSCLYGDNPCATPDWGDARDDSRDPGARPMFANRLVPYLSAPFDTLYNPAIGKTDWPGAVAAGLAINWGGPYDADREDVYYGVAGQYAVNLLLVERWGINCVLDGVVRPERVTLVATSVWDNERAADLGVGDTGVWPNIPRTRCFQWGQGWTWYVDGASGRSGSRDVIQSGFAHIARVDGSAAAVRYWKHEQCSFLPGPNVYVYTNFDPRF